MSYTKEKHKVFTPEGVKKLIVISTKARNLLNESGAFMSGKVFDGDAWLCLNCLDYLKEEGYLKELTPFDTPGQHRVYIAGKKPL